MRDRSLAFKDWVRLSYGLRDSFYFDTPKMFMPQKNWLTDYEGTFLVDELIRFENLYADFDRICQLIDVNADLPHLKKTSRKDYRSYYDLESYEIISHFFEKDISSFGYSFG